MTASVTSQGPLEYDTVLVRVMLEIDPNNNDLLQKQEMMQGLPGNCASRVLATKYLVFVGCARRGLMEVFRADTLEKIDMWTINAFTEEWSITSSS